MCSRSSSSCADALRALGVLTVVVSVALAAAPAHAMWQVTLFSDAHFDPAFGQPNAFGRCKNASADPYHSTGCDASRALMESTVAELATRSGDLLLYAGDWQRHGFEGSGVTAADIFTPFCQWVMSIPTSGRIASPAFAGSWGNNDVVPHDGFYTNATSQPMLEERAALMKAGGVLTEADASTFSKCAYYARRTPNVTIVVLHTLIWSKDVVPVIEDTASDPCGQFQFLADELSTAKASGSSVIVVGHIPPVLDVFVVLSRRAFTSESTDMFWRKGFLDRYEALLSQYKDTVKLQIFGHTHVFSLFAFNSTGVPSLVLPSISPLFGNSPAYLLSTFSDTWELEEMKMRYLSEKTWVQGMDVKGALGLQNGFNDISGLQTALYDLARNDRLWNNFLQLHSGGVLSYDVYPDNSCNSFCRAVFVCSMVSSSYAEIKKCVPAVTAPARVPVNLVGSIITTVLIIGVVLAVAILIVLYHLIPKIRNGDVKFSKFEFDIRAQLLNATPKKEKLRRKAAAEARRAEVVGRYREDVGEDQFSLASGHGRGGATAMAVSREANEEMVSVPVRASRQHREDSAGFIEDVAPSRE